MKHATTGSKHLNRVIIALLAIAAVITIGAAIAWLTEFYASTGDTVDRLPVVKVNQAESAGPANNQANEIHQHFQQAVIMLHATQYQNAIISLKRVLELAPGMPEAHTNMGFALLGAHQYSKARESFSAAIDLRKSQHNALYGLAMAHEGLGDLESALGAMRSYVHLTSPESPYARKAKAAIWEWESALQKRTQTNVPGQVEQTVNEAQ